MPPKSVNRFSYREFTVVVALDGEQYVAVGRDDRGQEVARVAADTQASVERDIKLELLPKSSDFVGVGEAKELFLRAYPKGFYDPYFDFDERDYKLKAHVKALTLLSHERLSRLLVEKRFGDVALDAGRVFTNLIFPNERMRYGDFEKDTRAPHEAFAEHLVELLWGSDFDRSFDAIANLLAPYGAAKWTILTYWPFVVHPNEHIFMKPEMAQATAWRLADDFGYESAPHSEIYRRFLAFTTRLRDNIGALKPRDFIDVQTFMYAVGKPGFVRDTQNRRELWEARQKA